MTLEEIYTSVRDEIKFHQNRHRGDGLPAVKWSNGTNEWWLYGQRHRGDGLPAIERRNSLNEWWFCGQLHRDNDLPALERRNGEKRWYKNGKLHREGGRPAVEYPNGSKYWWVNGLRHREGGLPAIVGASPYGTKAWYINGKRLSNEKGPAYNLFCQKMKEKIRSRAQKKIYFWWIQICYDLDHPSGCGKRMAQRNLDVFKNMMNMNAI